MNVERQIGHGFELLDERHAERQVRNEMAVHHIDVDEIGAGTLEHANIALEVHEVGRQD